MGANASRMHELERRITALEDSTRNNNTRYIQLQQRYADLHARHEALLSEGARGIQHTEETTNINLNSIDGFVDEILADPNANIYYLPDIAERSLYTNVLKMCMVLLQRSVANLKISLIGHELHVQMVPSQTNTGDANVPNARNPVQ